MKTRNRRGMRDIATIQSRTGHAVPRSREHATAELARLEHEKARLEREMRIWNNNLQRTEKQLQQVENRITLLENSIERSPLAGTVRTSAHSDNRRESTGDWHAVVLEY